MLRQTRISSLRLLHRHFCLSRANLFVHPVTARFLTPASLGRYDADRLNARLHPIFPPGGLCDMPFVVRLLRMREMTILVSVPSVGQHSGDCTTERDLIHLATGESLLK